MITRRALLLGSAAAVAAPASPLGADGPLVGFMNECWSPAHKRYIMGGVLHVWALDETEGRWRLYEAPCENERFGER